MTAHLQIAYTGAGRVTVTDDVALAAQAAEELPGQYDDRTASDLIAAFSGALHAGAVTIPDGLTVDLYADDDRGEIAPSISPKDGPRVSVIGDWVDASQIDGLTGSSDDDPSGEQVITVLRALAALVNDVIAEVAAA